MTKTEEKTLVILAGGKSRRMGRDKTFLPYRGTTFLEYLVGRARGSFDRILVAAGTRSHGQEIRQRLASMEQVEIIEDLWEGLGPMGGLLSVFEQAQVNSFVTVAVDIPEADMQVLAALLEKVRSASDRGTPRPYGAVMFSFDRRYIETCAAAYHRQAVGPMRAALERKEFSIRKALGEEGILVLGTEQLQEICPGITRESLQRSFRNVNTSEELQELKKAQQPRIPAAPEILAPAGTWDALQAAVNAGCDAVYLGGQMFGARAYAGNFDQGTLIRALDHCHLFGVRIYMTVNTLLKESEIGELIPYMEPYYQAGLDSVIVQDVGVIRMLREAYPKLPLHGSTQMSISSACGAELLRSLGLTRVVPARELTLEEIRKIREQVDIEIETFVHGAMCYAYSGKCLFSSFLGGRSGNRGRCAQPCRQLYDMGNGTREYCMSMKDMCTLSILPRLVDAGIHSFKIEGRMKNPVYVGATTRAYRKARDRYLELLASDPEAKDGWESLSAKAREDYLSFAGELTEQMQDIYNRGGFHAGYYDPLPLQGKDQDGSSFRREKGPEMISRERPNHTGILVGQVEQKKGPEVRVRLIRGVRPHDVLEILPAEVELTSGEGGKAGEILRLKGRELQRIKPGMQVYRTRNNTLIRSIEQEILEPEKKITARARVTARIGEPLQIVITGSDAIQITVTGGIVEPASGKPASAPVIREKMKKTGGTHVALDVECELDEQAFIPMSMLNELRRQAVDAYKEAVCRQYRYED